MDELNNTPENITTIHVVPANLARINKNWYWAGVLAGSVIVGGSVFLYFKEQAREEHISALERENRKLRLDNKLYEQRIRRFLEENDDESADE